MATQHRTGWQTTVADIESAIADCMAALDRYEAAFGHFLDEERELIRKDQAPAAPSPESLAHEWDDRLAPARQTADEVEGLLAEQEALWNHWQHALAEWQHLAGTEPTAPHTTTPTEQATPLTSLRGPHDGGSGSDSPGGG